MSSPKIKALHDQINSGKMKIDKARILDFIIKFPGSNKVLIGKYLSLPHQTVTARLSQLEDLGAIGPKGDGKLSEWYYIPEANAQRIHAAKRAAEKLEHWAKKGLQLDLPEAVKSHLQTLIAPTNATT